ncbi:MAG: DUF3806 domain-containing protein [Hyphomicrobiales bacterium]|nr:DUF3806 domain-containing protein [Hyphomicrobiales bacterium]
MARSAYICDLQPEDQLDLAVKRDWVLSQCENPERVVSVEARLHLLDTIIKSKVIGPDETVELQALGVVLGDAIAQTLELEWCMYEDENGRDPALIVPDTTIKIFPLTLISKRIEDGEEVDVTDLFAVLCAQVKLIAQEARRHAS